MLARAQMHTGDAGPGEDKGVVTLCFSIISHPQLGWGWGLAWTLTHLPGEMLQLLV